LTFFEFRVVYDTKLHFKNVKDSIRRRFTMTYVALTSSISHLLIEGG